MDARRDFTEGNEGNEGGTKAFKVFILPIASVNLDTLFVDTPLKAASGSLPGLFAVPPLIRSSLPLMCVHPRHFDLSIVANPKTIIGYLCAHLKSPGQTFS
jgi:hypothetical protein